MDIIEKTKNNILSQETRDGEPLATYSFIEERTGGLLTPLNQEDKIYVERINDAIPTGRITNVEMLALYMATNTIQQTRRKLIEVSEITDTITIDLSPYKLYSKFRIQFPATRTIPDISISIEGIADLKYGLESIIMSGLGSDTDYLSSDKRGTITFTLDSADYEFPSSIYHFGSFATGGTPATIFLHIDYTEADSSSPFKYVAENAIYADTGKIACELWSINTVPDPDVGELIAPFKENSTLVLKYNGVLSQSGYDAMVNPKADLHWYISFQELDANAGIIDYFGADLLDVDHQIYFGGQMPILKSTGILNINNKFYMNAMTRHQSGNIANTSTYFYSDRLFWTLGTENIKMYLSPLRGNMLDESRWDTLPTDFGLYRVIVKGKFAQNQLNN